MSAPQQSFVWPAGGFGGGGGGGGGGTAVAIPTRVLYVDQNRTDSYTANGSIAFPFKTIAAAIAQVITNADNASFAYCISINTGDYAETISLNNAALVNLTFQGVGEVEVSAITSTSNNSQLTTILFYNITAGDVTLSGSGNFCQTGCSMYNGTIANLSCTGVISYFGFDQFVTGDITCVDSAMFLTGGTQHQGTNTTVTGASFFELFQYQDEATTITVGTGAFYIGVGAQIGASGGTVALTGTMRLRAGSLVRSNVHGVTGSTLTLESGSISGTTTMDSGSTTNINNGSFSGSTSLSGTVNSNTRVFTNVPSATALATDAQGKIITAVPYMWAGNQNTTDYQSAISATMGDFSVVSGTPVFTETLNKNFGTVTSTVDGGSLPIPGIIFVPPVAGIYEVQVCLNMQPLTATNQAAIQLTDGSTIYDSTSVFGATTVNAGQILIALLDVTSPSSTTLKLQGAATAGRCYINQKSNGLNADTSRVKWTIKKVG